jgi:hypothetical protein
MKCLTKIKKSSEIQPNWRFIKLIPGQLRLVVQVGTARRGRRLLGVRLLGGFGNSTGGVPGDIRLQNLGQRHKSVIFCQIFRESIGDIDNTLNQFPQKKSNCNMTSLLFNKISIF